MMQKQVRRKRGKPGAGTRDCGECRACCVVTGFEAEPGESAFTKPPNTPCRHLVQIGCGIYPERPPVCRRFQCAWLAAPNLPEELRPDRSGVMFNMNENALGEGFAVYAYELRPGALDTPLPRWLIEEVVSETTVMLVRPGQPVEVLTSDPTVQEQFE